MDLEQKLDEEIQKNIWSKESIDRVRKVVELIPTRKNVPYRLFEEIEDYQLYYELHTEWKGKSTYEMRSDTESGVEAFYVSFILWTNKQTEDVKERKRLRQTIFKPKQKWIQYHTINDWVKEYESHPEWNGKSISEMQKDTESGGRTFYNAFYIWTISQTEDKKEQKKLRQTIFKPKRKTIDDWIKKYESHPEWNGKSTYEIQKDKESGAYAFYRELNKWTNKQTEDVEERKRLRQTIFKPKQNKWSEYQTLEDWIKKYESHTEWNGKSISEMKMDVESGASAFYQSFRVWTNKQTEDVKERKRLRQTIFKPKQKWIEYNTIDDWITEYNSHPEWNGKSYREIRKDTESEAKAFYQSFRRWTNKQTEDKNERKELRRKVFPNLR